MAWVVGACSVVALAGVAAAVGQPAPRPVWSGPETSATGTPAPADRVETDPVLPGADRPASAPAGHDRAQPATGRDENTSVPAGRDRIGTLKPVERVLGYLDGERSTTLHYPGADYVKVHFDRLLMLPGDHVTVASPDGTEVHRIDGDPVDGLVDALRGSPAGRWAMSVSGDTAVVTLHRARPDLLGLESRLAGLGVGIDRVAHGRTGADREAAAETGPGAAGPGREESICGRNDSRDAICYRSSDPVAYQRSKAVARLLINGTELCTAWRLGATNRMMTNHHCFTSSDEAYQTEVWFNYQCASCGGYEVFRSTKVWGDQVLSTDRTLDYTLFTVEDFPAVEKFGYLELDLRRPTRGTELYIPQHPGGDPTVIAMSSDRDANGTCAVDNPSYDGYGTASDISYHCDTEGGSSGSPVISRSSNKVIALHHFGGCPNSGVRIDLIHERIRQHL
ncbi:serine protease [Polymorphospora rubra]|uniref:trypsin-like serine peptidase n=1 Tax=Polymorphospora rubra TaxID=338584 RepID=UPI0033FE8037